MSNTNSMYEEQQQALQNMRSLSSFVGNKKNGGPGKAPPLDNTLKGLKSEGYLGEKEWNAYKGAWRDGLAPYASIANEVGKSPAVKAAQKLKELHDGPGIRNTINDKANDLTSKLNDLAKSIDERGFNAVSKDAVNSGLENARRAGTDGLKKLGKAGLEGYKGMSRMAGEAVMGSPVGQVISSASDTARNASEVGKTIKTATQALAAGNPVGATAVVGKELLKDLATDPGKAFKKFMMFCGCALSPILMACAVPILFAGFLISMFASLFSNDSAKTNVPKAESSWVYKYASDKGYMDTIKSKVNIDPEQTFIVSHNAKLQIQKIKESDKGSSEVVIPEDSDEMRKSEGYTNEPIFLYHEPNTGAKREISTLRYGQVVVAVINDKGDVSYAGKNGEFLAIELPDPAHLEKYQTEGKTGLENPNRASQPKITRYIESRLVYKKETHDPRLEYTIKDEYELMSTALKQVLRDKLDSSVKQGNARIDAEASKYQNNISDAELSSNSKYKKLGAAILYDGDRIVEAASSITNPNFDTFDVGGSRALLNASTPSFQGLNQDVATILSGYAVSKADSLPEEGYYRMLDQTMTKYLKNSLNLQGGQLNETPMTRILSSKKVVKYSVLDFSRPESRETTGIVVLYNSDKMENMNVLRFSVIAPSSGTASMVNPDSKNKNYIVKPIAEDIFVYEDIPTNSRTYYKENIYGEFAIVSPEQYLELYPGTSLETAYSLVRYYHQNFANYKEIRATSRQIENASFPYKEYKYAQRINPLNAEEVVWEFFAQTGDYYPVVSNGQNTIDAYGNKINISSAASWPQKYKLTRSLPYYQQKLSYLFDNSNLEGNKEYFKFDNPLKLANYPGEDNYIYAKIVSGAPANDLEKIYIHELEKITKDKAFSDMKTGNGDYVINYKKIIAENYSSVKLINTAGNKAIEKKFLWIIPLGYKQEYRRATEPEKINLNKLDPNMEYVTTYQKLDKNIIGTLPPGSLAVPIKNWQNHISSRWEPNRYVDGNFLPHFALDIAVPIGTPIYSVSDGVVMKTTVGIDLGGQVVPGTPGTGIWIRNEQTDMVFFYNHLNEQSESALMVHVGDKVVAGQQIGTVGNTGVSSGPHLHFQIFKSSSNLSHSAESSIDAEKFLNDITTTVAIQPATPSSNSNSSDNNARAADENSREQVIMSVGNKMDYWFDNIMTMLSEQDNNMTGTGGRAVVELAMSYLGDVGGKYIRTEFWGDYAWNPGGYVDPGGYNWCAAFVSIILRDAGVQDIAPHDAGVGAFVEWGKSNGYIHDDDGNYIPKPGDFVIFEWGGSTGYFDHIGFVYSADASGFRTIEGNTAGEGDEDAGGWKGVVNSHSRGYNDSRNTVKFISVPYPDQDDPSIVIAEYAQKALGTMPNTVDAYGRAGIGAWSGIDLVSLLKEIEKQHKSEVAALIAEADRGSELRSIIDGKIRVTQSTASVVKKMLSLQKSKSIQTQMLQNRIQEIDKQASKLFGDKWNNVDSRAKVYIVNIQLLMDSYGEKNWMSKPKVKDAISGSLDKKGSIDTVVSALSPFIKGLGSVQDKEYLSYNNFSHLLSFAGKEDSQWRDLFNEAKGKIAKIEITVKSIPDERLTFGLGNGKEFVLPHGLGSTKSFMGNHMLGDHGTKQAEMKHISQTGPNGVAMIDGRIVIAMYAGPPGYPKGYGSVGDKIDILLSTGQILHCVIGDAKAIEADSANYDILHNYSYDMVTKWGIHNDGSVMEFVLNTRHAGRYPDVWPSFTSIYPGYVVKVVNLGPYR